MKDSSKTKQALIAENSAFKKTIQKLEKKSSVNNIAKHDRIEHDYQILFREMLEGFALHEIICDAQGQPVDYRFIIVNPAFERMTGLKATKIVGRTVLEVLPDTEQYWIETYGRVALTGETAFFENYSKALDKFFLVTAFQPAPNQFACIFVDITERKRVEDDLRKSKEMNTKLIATMPDIMVLTNLSGEIVFINDVGLSFSNYQAKEIIGQSMLLFIAPEDQDRAVQTSLLMLERKLGPQEYHLIMKDGRKLLFEVNGDVLRHPDGSPYAMVRICRNITERKQAEEEKRRLEER
ncbi:MAG: PAS domain-containing protein, partial [Smithellaceae bacterium]